MSLITGSDLITGITYDTDTNTFLMSRNITVTDNVQIMLRPGDTFDGNNHKFSLSTDFFCTGLFWASDQTVTSDTMPLITRLGVEGGVLSSDCGYLIGSSAVKHLKITQCYSTGPINKIGSAGLVGHLTSTSDQYILMKDCYSTGLMSGINATVAGLIGRAQQVSIVNCHTRGNIDARRGVGIIQTMVNGSLDRCYSSGQVSGALAAGIVGSCGSDCTITNCYSLGTVSGNNAAGIIRSLGYVTIDSCYVAGAVASDCGGIAYDLIGPCTVRNSYVSLVNDGANGLFVNFSTVSDTVSDCTISLFVGSGGSSYTLYGSFGQDGTSDLVVDPIDVLGSDNYLLLNGSDPGLLIDSSDAGIARRWYAQQMLSFNTDSTVYNYVPDDLDRLNCFDFQDATPSLIQIVTATSAEPGVGGYYYNPDISSDFTVGSTVVGSASQIGGSYTVNGSSVSSSDVITTSLATIILGSAFMRIDALSGEVGGDPHIKPVLGRQILLNNNWRLVKMYSDGQYQVVAQCRHLPSSMTHGYLHKQVRENGNWTTVRTSRADRYITNYTYFTYLRVYRNNQELFGMHLINGKVRTQPALKQGAAKGMRLKRVPPQGLFSLTHHHRYPSSPRAITYQLDLKRPSGKLNTIVITIDDFWDDVNHIQLICRDPEQVCGELYQHNTKNRLSDWTNW